MDWGNGRLSQIFSGGGIEMVNVVMRTILVYMGVEGRRDRLEQEWYS